LSPYACSIRGWQGGGLAEEEEEEEEDLTQTFRSREIKEEASPVPRRDGRDSTMPSMRSAPSYQCAPSSQGIGPCTSMRDFSP
jgi:hypothetical protein